MKNTRLTPIDTDQFLLRGSFHDSDEHFSNNQNAIDVVQVALESVSSHTGRIRDYCNDLAYTGPWDEYQVWMEFAEVPAQI